MVHLRNTKPSPTDLDCLLRIVGGTGKRGIRSDLLYGEFKRQCCWPTTLVNESAVTDALARHPKVNVACDPKQRNAFVMRLR